MPGARQNLNRPQKGIIMQAVTTRDRAAGAAGLTLSDIPHPHAAENDVIVGQISLSVASCQSPRPAVPMAGAGVASLTGSGGTTVS